MAETVAKRIVIVVDDDPQMREAITLMVESAGLVVETFSSAEEFLEAPFRHDCPRCLILDVRMRGLSGLGLQIRLTQQGVRIPIIFLTGYGDVSTAVQAIRSGGFDFLEKPLHRDLLLERIVRALDFDAQLLIEEHRSASIEKRIESLSRREREVISLLIEGRTNKEIARILEIGLPTVTKHRTRVLHKVGVRNLFELANLAARSQSLGSKRGTDTHSDKQPDSASNDPEGGSRPSRPAC